MLGPLRFTNALGGASDFIYPGPAIDMQSPASAGAADGTAYVYYAQTFDMSQWEKGIGVYTASSGTFARTTVIANSSGTTAKINFSSPPQVFVIDSTASLGGRQKLSGSLTLYVRTDGNDANNGLTNTSTGAFQTIQAAYNALAANYDTAGFTTTILGTAGVNSFTAGLNITQSWVGGGPVILDLGTGGQINYSGGNAILSNTTLPANLTLQNIKFSSPATPSVHVNVSGPGQLVVGANCEFGSCTTSGYHMVSRNGGTIACGSNYTISGDCAIHAYAKTGGIVDLYAGVFGTTTTIGANINVGTAFAYADPIGGVVCISSARTIALGGHTVTGTRYTVLAGGAINTQGGGANYFPGTVAGGGAGAYL